MVSDSNDWQQNSGQPNLYDNHYTLWCDWFPLQSHKHLYQVGMSFLFYWCLTCPFPNRYNDSLLPALLDGRIWLLVFGLLDGVISLWTDNGPWYFATAITCAHHFNLLKVLHENFEPKTVTSFSSPYLTNLSPHLVWSHTSLLHPQMSLQSHGHSQYMVGSTGIRPHLYR